MRHLLFRVPALLHHVLHVVHVCTRRQMARVHARWVIARVQNDLALIQRAIDECVRVTMGHDHAHPGDAYLAIAFLVGTASPEPAVVIACDLDIPPELLGGVPHVLRHPSQKVLRDHQS